MCLIKVPDPYNILLCYILCVCVCVVHVSCIYFMKNNESYSFFVCTYICTYRHSVKQQRFFSNKERKYYYHKYDEECILCASLVLPLPVCYFNSEVLNFKSIKTASHVGICVYSEIKVFNIANRVSAMHSTDNKNSNNNNDTTSEAMK